MKKFDLSPWITDLKHPVKPEDQEKPEIVLTLLDSGITIPAFWHETENCWHFQQLNGFNLVYGPIEDVEVLAWMYIPYPTYVLGLTEITDQEEGSE